jgi:hypothetical protein
VRKTPVDLYRMGNAISSRMENIRAKDIDMYEADGKMWVEIPNELRVVNDYGNHWLWEPSYSMPLDEYQRVLESVGNLFYKVS